MGFGVMGEALCNSWVLREILSPSDVVIYDPAPQRMTRARERGFGAAPDLRCLASQAQTLVLSVKPQNVPQVLEEIGPIVSERQLLISVAAGISTASLETRLPRPVPLVRAMPNLPCIIGQGMLAFSTGRHAGAVHIDTTRGLLGGLGRMVQVNEEMMDGATGLSGSGPAFMFLIIEALADAGVYMGFPREAALEMAAQTALGSARMVLESGLHPAQLRDMVTSPGGTAIAGLHSMERASVRAAVMDAVLTARERSRALGQKACARDSARSSSAVSGDTLGACLAGEVPYKKHEPEG
jgi:pyrroline-5-carboxylate reductase